VAPTGDATTGFHFFQADTVADRVTWQAKLVSTINSKPYLIDANSIEEGYLYFSSNSSAHMKKYYCQLSSEKLQLKKRRADTSVNVEILLPGHAVVHDHWSTAEVKYGFCITIEDTPAFFAFPSLAVKNYWIALIFQILATKDFRVRQDSIQEGILYEHATQQQSKFFVLTEDRLIRYKKRGGNMMDEFILTQDSKVEAVTPHGFELTYVRARNTRSKSFYVRSAKGQQNWMRAFSMVFSRLQVPPLFGGTIRDAVARDSCAGMAIPVIVQNSVEFLTQHALSEVGLFRVPGLNDRIQELKHQYEREESVELDEQRDVHSVAGVLKLYLRQLGNPVIPFDDYKLFVRAAEQTADGKIKFSGMPGSVAQMKAEEKSDLELTLRRRKFMALCNNLPPANKAVLNYLLHFLTLVVGRSSVNKMNADNCAMVFAPSLLRRPQDNEDDEKKAGAPVSQKALLAAANAMKRELALSQSVITFLIEQYMHLFPGGPPTLTRSATASPPAYVQQTNLDRYNAFLAQQDDGQQEALPAEPVEDKKEKR
jgi:hypothetical protein